MLKALMLSSLLCSFTAISADLPKDVQGQYAGEMGSYTVVKNDIELTVEEHDVKVTITEENVVYRSGKLTLVGAYEYIKQSNGEYLVIAKLTNGKTVNFDLELVVNKKSKSVVVNGKNGEPDVACEKLTY